MKKIKLSPRLYAIASHVNNGLGVADVGTDHGYIPIFLAQNGYSGRIFASDINEGPINSAISSAKEYNVSDKISFFCSDGLDFCSGNGIDTVIIAGMGGETMVHILSQAKWLADMDIRLILQPQSKMPELYDWLSDNGYSISDAGLVRDAGRIYCIYTAEKCAVPMNESVRISEKNVNHLLIDKKDALLSEYVKRLLKKIKKEADGMSKGKSPGLAAELYEECADYEKILLETEKW